MSGPIASLDEPEYQSRPAAESDGAITTSEAVFPGTDLQCFAYEGTTRSKLRDQLLELTRIPGDDPTPLVYPGPQPVSIDRSHFDVVRQHRYAIAPKTDGVRACLMVTDIDDVHTVTVWDRTLTVPYGVSIHNVPRVMYQVGTVLDGEIVWDRVRSRWTYMVFDCFILNGLPQFHKNFWERLRCVSVTLSSAYTETHSDTLSVMVKPFTSLHEAPHPGHQGQIETAAFPSDGWILMPVDMAIVFGHHSTFFKLKTCHSVDFVIRKDGVFVFNTDTKRLVKAGVCRDAPATVDDGAIIECELDVWHAQPTKRVWRYLATRTDKSKSNTLFVLNKTLLNMEEKLGYADIRRLAPM